MEATASVGEVEEYDINGPDIAATYCRLVSVRTQLYSALVETDRALARLNPDYERRYLSRSERQSETS